MKKIVITILMAMMNVITFSQHIYNVKVSEQADGKFEQIYGAITVSGDVLNGMKVGNWVENYPNSDLPHYIIQYKEGKKNGLYLEFDKQAKIIKKIEYKDDLIHGTNLAWKNGRISVKQEYKDGKLNGKSLIYTDKGFVQEESEYKEGKRHGVTTWYMVEEKIQGPKYVMYTYQDGKFEGVQETYYENGNVKTRKMFSNNVQHGPAIEYYEDGKVKSEANYKNGELKGKVKEYD